MRRAAGAIRVIDGGQWGDDLAVPTTSSPGPRRPAGTSSAGSLTTRQGFQLRSAARVAAVMAWRRGLQARVVQVRDRAVLGAAWHQPSGAPRQRLPAGNVMARCFSDG